MRRCEIVINNPDHKYFAVRHPEFHNGDVIIMTKKLNMLHPDTLDPIYDHQDTPFDDDWELVTSSNCMEFSFFDSFDLGKKVKMERGKAGKKVTIEFTADEDGYFDELGPRRAISADKAYVVIDQIWQRCFRPYYKHGYPDTELEELAQTELAGMAIDKIGEIYHEVLRDEGIDHELL